MEVDFSVRQAIRNVCCGMPDKQCLELAQAFLSNEQIPPRERIKQVYVVLEWVLSGGSDAPLG